MLRRSQHPYQGLGAGRLAHHQGAEVVDHREAAGVRRRGEAEVVDHSPRRKGQLVHTSRYVADKSHARGKRVYRNGAQEKRKKILKVSAQTM